METVAAVLLGIAGCVWAARLYFRQSDDRAPTNVPTSLQRSRAADRLWEYYPAFPDDDPDTALFLLEEAKHAYKSIIESNGKIEASASSFIGFIAGGAGLLSIFSAGQPNSTRLAAGPFLFLAIGSAFVSLLFCGYLLRPKLRAIPDVAEYTSAPVALYSKARFHVALALAERFNEAFFDIAKLRRFDGVTWTCAQMFLAIAAFGILINFGITTFRKTTPLVHVLQCSGRVDDYRGTAPIKLDCKDDTIRIDWKNGHRE